MDFRIADTFTDSLARLTGDEQKAVKTTAFDLQLNPANPGMQFHKLDRARDRSFWSVRVSADIRLIVHRSDGSLLLCYVDHHDKAYDWAERRKLETHPRTGAAQFVEIRETVKEIIVPVYVHQEQAAPTQSAQRALFADTADGDLLGFGVPSEWLNDVKAATDATLLALVEHLPAEAAEALLELATGGSPRGREPVAVDAPFEHPDALRRFRIMANAEELERALEFPWDKWTVFLHPEQRALVDRAYGGPARVAGTAGTGKTVVALHRAVHLARANANARVLLTTFSETLARALQTKLRRLIATEPRLGERIDVHSLDAVGQRLYQAHIGPVRLVNREVVTSLLAAAAAAVPDHAFALPFIVSEWDQVVDAWQLDTWEAYRDVNRLGRRTRLPEARRRVLWSILERTRTTLGERGLLTRSAMFSAAARAVATSAHPPFEFSVVDEAQDVSVAQLRLLAALGGNRPNALFFAGDLGQRIFQQPFSWRSLGVDVRGRSRVLRVNYRTSHQIRMQADKLLGPVVADADGIEEERRGVVSAFNGPRPEIRVCEDQPREADQVSKWLRARVADGVLPHEIGVFVRSDVQLDRARMALTATEVPFAVIDERMESKFGHIVIGTMHLAKGLEFRAVVVMACDDDVLPLQERIEAVGDDGDFKEVYDTERQLVYVACTRARDHLLVSAVRPGSEFLEDMV